MSDQPTDSPEVEKIEAVFRNGSVTSVGVVVGFSLTFLTSWATSLQPWRLWDLFGMVPLATGIAFQLVALAAMLRIDSLVAWRYRRAVRQFLIGVGLVATGVVLVLVIDLLAAVEVID
jgi:hypothetical protein